MTKKLLLIEDDAEMAAFILSGLKAQGHDVTHANDGISGQRLAGSGDYAALIVDRMLPQMSGLDIVKQLRAAGSDIPVMFLTTMSGIDDRVEGLEAGADDYLVKPFALSELLARVNALTRRASRSAVTRLQSGDLEMDLLARRVRRGTREIDLQPQEFRLLEYLVRNAGRVVTRTMLLENVWDLHFDPRTNIVETHVSRLRAKIDCGGDIIRTVRGVGYIIDAT